ncbi:MAG: hypothetical protein ACK43K_07010, partial [Chitinophagales bacterium]
ISSTGVYYASFYDPVNDCYSGFGGAITPVLVIIEPCGPCNSGYESPKLNAFYLESICPDDFVDISSVTASNKPSGVVLTWHTGYPVLNSNKVTGTKIFNQGWYYVSFYDAVNDCYANGGLAVAPVYIRIKVQVPIPNILPSFRILHYSNSCPSTTFDLSAISPINPLPGYSLSWHSSLPATIANKMSLTTMNSVGAGTYYAVFQDTKIGCFGSGIQVATPIVVSIINCTDTCNDIRYLPTLSQLNLSNICPKVTADLSSITVSNLPPNNILTWHYSTPATDANRVVDPTKVGAGVFYASFMHATRKCYADFGNSTVKVTVTINPCGTPCDTVKLAPDLAINWLKNICPIKTVDLTKILAKNKRTGLDLTWHTSFPATNANRVANPSLISSTGVYYASFYDPVNDCYSGFGGAITPVLVIIEPCGPCNSGYESPKLNAFYLESICPDDFVDISSVTASNKPSGVVLTWHTGYPASNSNKITGTKIYNQGWYYVSFYDAVNDCYANGGLAVAPVFVRIKDCGCKEEIIVSSNKFVLCDPSDKTTVFVNIPKTLSGCITNWLNDKNVLLSSGTSLVIDKPGIYTCIVMCSNCIMKKIFDVVDCNFKPTVEQINLEDWNSNSLLKVVNPADPIFNPWIWSRQHIGPVYTGNPYSVDHCLDAGWYEVVSERCILCPNSKARIYFDPKNIKYKK